MAAKILIRAGMAPEEHYSVREICRNNRFGDNVGNLLYAYSLFRWLMTEADTCILPDRYRPENGLVTDGEIDRINQEYQCYVIPLADAFRNNFERHLTLLTAFVRKLRIPVVLIGGGMAARLEDPSHVNRVSDRAICDFLDAVLDHSAIAGFRGEYTLDYLEKLGYLPEKQITVIGCPSVFTFGPKIRMRVPDVSRICADAPLIITNNIYSNDQTHRFLRRTAREYPDYLFLPQRVEELRMMYWGKDLDLSGMPKDRSFYPVSLQDELYRRGHALFPLDVTGWLATVRRAAFATGPRLHGGIACILSGVPVMMVLKDHRMKEVADYHHFACVRQSDLTESTRLADLAAKADFRALPKGHEQNFLHYCDFLRTNGLAFIYQDKSFAGPAPLDRKLKKVSGRLPVRPYHEVSAAEKLRRCAPDAKTFYEMLPEDAARQIRKTFRRYI